MVLHLATFLQANPREVVVVELTHVYNARDDVLDVLRNLLSRVLGPWLDRECRCVCASDAAVPPSEQALVHCIQLQNHAAEFAVLVRRRECSHAQSVH